MTAINVYMRGEKKGKQNATNINQYIVSCRVPKHTFSNKYTHFSSTFANYGNCIHKCTSAFLCNKICLFVEHVNHFDNLIIEMHMFVHLIFTHFMHVYEMCTFFEHLHFKSFRLKYARSVMLSYIVTLECEKNFFIRYFFFLNYTTLSFTFTFIFTV